MAPPGGGAILSYSHSELFYREHMVGWEGELIVRSGRGNDCYPLSNQSIKIHTCAVKKGYWKILTAQEVITRTVLNGAIVGLYNA